MGLPKIVYGAGQTVLLFKRGPQGFDCYYDARTHDNLATSGVLERITEKVDILISFTMGYLRVSEDLPEWDAFMAFAIPGQQFDFYPNVDINFWVHCKCDDKQFRPRPNPRGGWYTAGFNFRVTPDSQAPASPVQVLQRFYGIV